MPRRRSRAKETGSAVTGGAAAGTVNTSADEATHCGRNNEEISGATGSTTIDYFPSR
jgi:hypothetical protein